MDPQGFAMHRFEEQETAVLTAETALGALLGEHCEPPARHPGMNRRQWLRSLLGGRQ
ncbi:hypothetical protein [Thioalbus denitrificans]|uniref:Uncharacterized protein n=1 Tax=Thioalbus denitrificans TaxID=547122 RepID=A0A369CJG8_9GAMM|nr:hypothetical protein [Thioalbus denitrificans]RCX32846.1 hypothetical protein DFQ59_101144 [Thioalbus denitrificans]